jgi:hypothetical protein
MLANSDWPECARKTAARRSESKRVRTRVLRELADDSPSVHRPGVHGEDGGEGLALPDPAVLRRNLLACRGGHEAPLEDALAALGVAPVEEGRERLVSPEAPVQLDTRRQPLLSRDIHDSRDEDEDACGVEIALARQLLVPGLGPPPQHSVVHLELRRRRPSARPPRRLVDGDAWAVADTHKLALWNSQQRQVADRRVCVQFDGRVNGSLL